MPRNEWTNRFRDRRFPVTLADGRYHRPGCCLLGENSVLATSVEVMSAGLSPCEVCHPPLVGPSPPSWRQ